jgi:hypothetical protein
MTTDTSKRNSRSASMEVQFNVRQVKYGLGFFRIVKPIAAACGCDWPSFTKEGNFLAESRDRN